MESNEKVLELVGKLVGQFLADNGGYYNHYGTYVIGKITPNKLGGITEFVTPGTWSANKNQITALCTELEKSIKRLIAIYDFDKEIVLEAKPVEWVGGDGCFLQFISITDKLFVPVPNKQDQVLHQAQAVRDDKKKKKEDEELVLKLKQQEEEDARNQRRKQDEETAMMVAISVSTMTGFI